MQKNITHKFFHHILVSCVFIVIVLIFRKDALNFRFDHNLVERYYHSQDITHEVSNRIFLSDGDVYLATGYLYAMGSDPSLNNFEHPPVIKYLFGFATILWNNPLIVQIIFGFILVNHIYAVGHKLTGKWQVGIISALLLAIDPLFLDILGQPLLDLGQTVFMLWYFYLIFYNKKNWIGQGMLLALFAGCKFWITPAFFIVIISLYKWYKHELSREYFLHLAFSLFVYAGFYAQSFMQQGWGFNLIWHMLKTLKYRLVHNTSTYFGASILLYTSGYWKSWWDNSGFIRDSSWTLLWPIGLLSTLYQSFKLLNLREISMSTIIAIFPISYLLFLGVQAPFPRYFLIFLPFIYISLARVLFDLINRHQIISK